MSRIIDALSEWQRRTPRAPAIVDASITLTYDDLANRVAVTAAALRGTGSHCIALLADNGIDWVVADLAALLTGITVIPLPPFFSEAQLTHLLSAAPVDTILTDNPDRLARLAAATDAGRLPGSNLAMLRVQHVSAAGRTAIAPISKITFTSGSTGAPKGVCLAAAGIERTAQGLAEALGDLGIRTHLCVVPLAMLLENIAGVYAPILLGACIHVPRLADVGLSGSSTLDIERMRAAIDKAGAESVILTPQLLTELTASAKRKQWADCPLRFAAVGGARLSDADIDDALRVGIPAYQGYGLSECNSVVTINRPNRTRRGSVGKALPGFKLRIAADGEILVGGSRMLGYLGEPLSIGGEVATGDLGVLDDDGYLYVTGRKKNVFVTSFGRNVSPEWPEAELTHQPEIAQAIVYGEGRPVNTAVIVPAAQGLGDRAIADAVARANRNLPDYARIGDWVIADAPFTSANGRLTPTGKPRRDAIIHYYMPDVAPAALRA